MLQLGWGGTNHTNESDKHRTAFVVNKLHVYCGLPTTAMFTVSVSVSLCLNDNPNYSQCIVRSGGLNEVSLYIVVKLRNTDLLALREGGGRRQNNQYPHNQTVSVSKTSDASF